MRQQLPLQPIMCSLHLLLLLLELDDLDLYSDGNHYLCRGYGLMVDKRKKKKKVKQRQHHMSCAENFRADEIQ